MKKLFYSLLLVLSVISAGKSQPVKKVLFEEFTGGWAGYCPRSFALRDSIHALYPNTFIPVSLHNNDGMATTQVTAIENQFGVNAYPEAMIDRKLFSGHSDIPVYTQYYLNCVNTQLSLTPPLSVNIVSNFNTSSRQSDVTVKIKFYSGATGNLRIHLFYVEDSVSNPASSYNQENYYGQGCAVPNPNSPYYNSPCVIPNFKHRFVFRYSASPLLGTAGIIPNVASAGDTFQVNYSYVVPVSFNAGRMNLVAFVTNTNNKVLNAESAPMSPCSVISCTIGASTVITNVTGSVCNNGKIKVNLSGIVNLYPHLELYNSIGNILYNVNLPSGSTTYTFNNLQPGTYMVKVFDGNCCETILANRIVKCPVPSSGFFTNNITSSGAKVHWNTVGCNAGFKVLYRKQGTTSWTTKTTSVNSKTLTGLLDATSYEWKVATNCANSSPAGYSANSALQTFTTLPLRQGGESNPEFEEPQISSLSLFPNPAAEQLNISFETGFENVQLQIINITGQLLLKKNIAISEGPQNEVLDVSFLPPGIYTVLVKADNSIVVKRFVKE